MIKLSIKSKPEPQEEKGFKGTLSLEQSTYENGAIDLKIQDNGDLDWYFIRIRPNGTFIKITGVDNDIGLQVDDEGKIIEGESE